MRFPADLKNKVTQEVKPVKFIFLLRLMDFLKELVIYLPLTNLKKEGVRKRTKETGILI